MCRRCTRTRCSAKYRWPAFTGEILTFCEHFMRAVCAELDTELAEFNGEADHMHLLVANPATLGSSTLMQRLKGRRTAYAIRRECPGRAATSVAVPLRCLLRRRTAIDHQALHRQPSAPPGCARR